MGYWMMCCNNVDNCNSATALAAGGLGVYFKMAALLAAALAMIL